MKDDTKRPDGFDALPKRFRDYVRGLESTIETLTHQVPSRASTEGARLMVVDRQHRGNDGYLSDDTRIRHSIVVSGGRPGIEEIEVFRSEHYEGIELRALSGSSLLVRPECANVVVVETDRSKRR